MAIYRLLNAAEGAAFGPEAVKAMALAYENALSALRLVDREDPVTEIIARKIIECAAAGEADPKLMCDAAIKAVQR